MTAGLHRNGRWQTFGLHWLVARAHHSAMIGGIRRQWYEPPLERMPAHSRLIAPLNFGTALVCCSSKIFFFVLDQHHLGGCFSFVQEQLSTPFVGGRLFHQKPSSGRCRRAAVQSCSTCGTTSRGCHSKIRVLFLRPTTILLLF